MTRKNQIGQLLSLSLIILLIGGLVFFWERIIPTAPSAPATPDPLPPDQATRSLKVPAYPSSIYEFYSSSNEPPKPYWPYPPSYPSPTPYFPYPPPERPKSTVAAPLYVPTIPPLNTLTPQEMATEIAWMKEGATITTESNGKTFTFTLTSRFAIFLDDEKYPLSQLRCEPEPVFGYISNGSFRGFKLYPVEYEAAKIGECVLRNGDFSATIIVIPLPTSGP
jgi:hypothetical protein